jgi:hypothetical protein
MDIVELTQYRDAVRAIIADASIAAADKTIIVAEAIKGLNMTRLSSAPHLRALLAREMQQSLDNLRKEPNGDLRAGPSTGADAGTTGSSSDSGSHGDQKVPAQAQGKRHRR